MILFKTITYRLISILTTGLVGYFITGSLELASKIMGLDAAIKIILYVLHEKVYNIIQNKYNMYLCKKYLRKMP